ncbi:oligomeric Golgi complex subunit 6 [Blyttiomyces helicus]|uniref:Conserved oligomeric Golgi complex subunit 6 n=1 Tax=Blyttiomyces helicus TaxID=388810 RepID=A0A4P9W9V2_9FUNG|nr:oligomeric Golgi complex subunit 6 [Blyttiomyces helicus]|eukprot:RKO87918.1 oligomeric Golgi complex subunit 6 [Blyttiomyces helicus]
MEGHSETTGTAPQAKLTKANPLSRKLQKILGTSLEDPNTQEALEALSEFYAVNSLAARRNLRSDIERRAMSINTRFLDAFEAVNEQLLEIEKEVQSVNRCYVEMEEKLAAATGQTAHLMKQTQDLKAKSARCQIRKSVVDVFLARFTLTDEEILVLTQPLRPVGPEFFESLKHLQQINDDCKALLITEHQKAGFEIMESMAGHQEAAYEKLFRWAQNECRSMNRDSPEVTAAMRDAMCALKQRPVLFQTCIDEISHIRRSAIVRSFLDALTRGGPGGFPRPIEIHAHDSLRYVGDMLAWLHQAAAGEREMLEGLFDAKPGGKPSATIPASNPLSPEGAIGVYEAEEQAISQILDKNLEGTCRPLRARVEQVLASQPGAITAYRIANLIQFYASIIIKALGPSAQLSLAVEEITEMAFKVFFDTLNSQASKLLRFVQTPNHDLLPPPAVKETILQLKEIMSSYDGSMVVSEQRENDFSEILMAILDPVLQMCVLGTSKLSPLENAIYMVNCLHHIQTALSLYSFTSRQVESIEFQIEAQIEVLVAEQYASLLQQSGLAPLMLAIEASHDKVPLALVPGMDSRSIADTMTRLDAFFYSVTGEVASTLSRVTSSRLTRRVTKRGFKMFIDAYRRLHTEVMDPANKYEFPSTILARTVEEVETLVAIGQDED